MLEALARDLRCESFIINKNTSDAQEVISLATVEKRIKKHSYMRFDNFLKTLEPHTGILVKAGTTINTFDFLGTVKEALDGGIAESFKNISGDPFAMNVAKAYISDWERKTILFIFVN